MTRRAKLTLREEQRIVALRVEGLTFEVIASRVGCSKGSVWNVLNAQACRAGSAEVVEPSTIVDAKVRGLSKKAVGKLP